MKKYGKTKMHMILATLLLKRTFLIRLKPSGDES
jgi:hypothetical protein